MSLTEEIKTWSRDSRRILARQRSQTAAACGVCNNLMRLSAATSSNTTLIIWLMSPGCNWSPKHIRRMTAGKWFWH